MCRTRRVEDKHDRQWHWHFCLVVLWGSLSPHSAQDTVTQERDGKIPRIQRKCWWTHWVHNPYEMRHKVTSVKITKAKPFVHHFYFQGLPLKKQSLFMLKLKRRYSLLCASLWYLLLGTIADRDISYHNILLQTLFAQAERCYCHWKMWQVQSIASIVLKIPVSCPKTIYAPLLCFKSCIWMRLEFKNNPYDISLGWLFFYFLFIALSFMFSFTCIIYEIR